MFDTLPSQRTAMRFILRLVLATLVVVVLLMQWGDVLAEGAVPVLRWTYSQLDHDHKIREFGVSDAAVLQGTDKVFRLEVVPDRLVLVGNHVVPIHPDGWARVSMLTAYLWQPISVALVGALAWPVRRRLEMAWRMVLLAIFCGALALLDVPFVLWAQVWRNYTEVFAPDAFSALLVWADFLQRGGRLLLGVAAASAAIGWASKLARLPHRLDPTGLKQPA
jgi:hypothetical protein